MRSSHCEPIEGSEISKNQRIHKKNLYERETLR